MNRTHNNTNKHHHENPFSSSSFSNFPTIFSLFSVVSSDFFPTFSPAVTPRPPTSRARQRAGGWPTWRPIAGDGSAPRCFHGVFNGVWWFSWWFYGDFDWGLAGVSWWFHGVFICFYGWWWFYGGFYDIWGLIWWFAKIDVALAFEEGLSGDFYAVLWYCAGAHGDSYGIIGHF